MVAQRKFTGNQEEDSPATTNKRRSHGTRSKSCPFASKGQVPRIVTAINPVALRKPRRLYQVIVRTPRRLAVIMFIVDHSCLVRVAHRWVVTSRPMPPMPPTRANGSFSLPVFVQVAGTVSVRELANRVLTLRHANAVSRLVRFR